MPGADLEQPRGHDLVASRETGDDLDLARAPLAELHGDELDDFRLALAAVDQPEDEVLVALRDQRLLGHEQRLRPLGQRQRHAGEEPGAQRVVGVGS